MGVRIALTVLTVVFLSGSLRAEGPLDTYQVISLPPEVYYLSFVPFKVRWEDLTTVAGLAVLLSLVAAAVPAWRASRLLPVEALRYE